MDINGKNIILIGASSGIGKEILDLLVAYEDVKIVAVARCVDSIPLMDGVVYPFACDVSTKEGVDKVFAYALEAMGDVDIFIANAGFAYLEKVESPDWEHIEKIYRLNVFSAIYSLEKLIEINKEKHKAFVCTISGAGLVSLPGYSLYCSTKAALHHFVRTYRYEKPQKIDITAVYPVATKTSFFDKASQKEKTPLPFLQQEARTVARKIVRGIEREKKSIYPSFLFRVFYPLGRMFPFLMHLYSINEKRKLKDWTN